MRTLVKIILFLVFHSVCQANKIERAINQYPQTLLSSGAKADDLLISRLCVQGLPKEFFNLPKQAHLREAFLIDMLAFYYLGYGVTSLFVKTDDGFFTRSFSEKSLSVREWQPVPQSTFENATTTLKEMNALPLNSMAIQGKTTSEIIESKQAQSLEAAIVAGDDARMPARCSSSNRAISGPLKSSILICISIALQSTASQLRPSKQPSALRAHRRKSSA
jgi:hypothetical protein